MGGMGPPYRRRAPAALRPLVSLLLLLPLFSSFAEPVVNLAGNASFETDVLGQVSMWTMEAQKNTPSAVRFFTTDVEKRSGTRSLVIANLEPNDARAVQWIRTKPNTWYRMSAWIQARDVVTEHVGANISVLGSTRLSGDLRDTAGEWKYVEMLGKTGPRQTSVAVVCRLGFYKSPAKGLAIFDDFSFEELPGRPSGRYDTVDLGNNNGAEAVVRHRRFAIEAPPGFVPLEVFLASSAALVSLAAVLGTALAAGVAVVARNRRRAALAAAAPAPEWCGPYKGIEHRRSPRAATNAQVMARKSGHNGQLPRLLTLRCENISDHGAFLSCADPSALALGDNVTLEAMKSYRVLRLGSAIVVGVRERFGGEGKLLAGGFALEFRSLGTAAVRARRKLSKPDGR